MTPGHIQCRSGFINKYKAARRKQRDFLLKGLTLFFYVIPVLLSRPESFFFKVGPDLIRALCIAD